MLTDGERSRIMESLQKVFGRNEPVALCAYGSRVGGYARQNSDYDAIAVLRNFRPRVRYQYIKGEAGVSALLVDSVAMEKDAYKAFLGEFVVGRLLNIYEPLMATEFLENVEKAYKRRVVEEAIKEIVAAEGDFANEIFVLPEYFLFDKLKKRATIYPPALYSYAKTYAGPSAESNLRASMKAFYTIIDEMAKQGEIDLEDGCVRISMIPPKQQMAKISNLLSVTARGFTQYAVHGYAGHVGLDVVGKEILSKLVRSRKSPEVPEQIKHPRRLWRISEGILLVDEEEWVERISSLYDLRGPVSISSHGLGEFYSVSKFYLLQSDGRSVKLAVKRYRDSWSIKWALLTVWTATSKKFNTSPISRLCREYKAIRALRSLGFSTPRIVAVSLDDTMMITEFVEGTNLASIVENSVLGKQVDLLPVYEYGRMLSNIHEKGFTLGDVKPSNAIITEQGITLTDLEQTASGGDRAWDIAEFIYYSAKFTLNGEAARRIAREFLRGYLESGAVESVRAALDLKYLAPFQIFLAPHISRAIREEVETLSKHFR